MSPTARRRCSSRQRSRNRRVPLLTATRSAAKRASSSALPARRSGPSSRRGRGGPASPEGGDAPLSSRSAAEEVGTALTAGQEEARLLEGLADDGDPVGETARLEAQQG